MTDTMPALVKREAGPGLWLEEVPVPQIRPGEVLIRVLRAGLCGTDLHIRSWDEWATEHVPVGTVTGHEFCGEVAEVGPGVSGIEVGDRVSGEGHLVCGQCRNCRAGRRHLCIRTVGLGVQRDGAFAEYVSLPAANVWVHQPFPDGSTVTPEIGALFDPFGNAVHTALTFPVLGEDVLITGAGPIGVMAIAVCRNAGARNIAITDVSPFRLELARTMGADRTIDVRTERIVEAFDELGMREGFDVALEMSGHADALRELITTMNHGGKVAMLGLPNGATELDTSEIILKMLTLQGIYGRQMYETWYAMSVLIERGLDLTPVITHRFGYADHDAAFDTAAAGDCGKVIIDWTTEEA